MVRVVAQLTKIHRVHIRASLSIPQLAHVEVRAHILDVRAAQKDIARRLHQALPLYP
jgi:hypothetical protein